MLPDEPFLSSPLVDNAVEDVREGVADVEISDLSREDVRALSESSSIMEIPEEVFLTSAVSSRTQVEDMDVQAEVKVVGSPTAMALQRLRETRQRKRFAGTEKEQEVPVVDEVIIPDSILGRYRNTTKEEWRKLVEDHGAASDVEDILDSDEDDSGPSSSFSAAARRIEEHIYESVEGQPTDPTRRPPLDRRGVAKREFRPAQMDEWNDRVPRLTHNPALHRAIFEAFIAEKELESGTISVSNTVDRDAAPPDFEFEYSNDMLYHPDVPDPEKSLGCDCEGPCDPLSSTCSCLKRQEKYFYQTQMTGFAYDKQGLLENTSISIWECSETCGCPPSCMNRVIQRGRPPQTKLEIFKTREKGWGVRAKAPIPKGQFIGIYAGELITEDESEKRGILYNEIGRTYIFDLDGWQIRNPPDGLEEIDSRLAETAEATAQRALEEVGQEDDETLPYNAYSGQLRLVRS